MFLHDRSGRYAFERLHEIRDIDLRMAVHHKVNMIEIRVELNDRAFVVRSDLAENIQQIFFYLGSNDLVPILDAPDDVVLDGIHVTASSVWLHQKNRHVFRNEDMAIFFFVYQESSSRMIFARCDFMRYVSPPSSSPFSSILSFKRWMNSITVTCIADVPILIFG